MDLSSRVYRPTPLSHRPFCQFSSNSQLQPEPPIQGARSSLSQAQLSYGQDHKLDGNIIRTKLNLELLETLVSSLGAERECFPSKEHCVSKCEQWVRFLEALGASEESHVGTDLF